MRAFRQRRTQMTPGGQRGQSLVEFTLVVPILLVLLATVGDLGLIFGKLNSLGYASREGARTGSALVRGENIVDCTDPAVDPEVDAVVLAAVQRVLTSPDSGIDLNRVRQVRIFRALADGSVDGTKVNVWKYRGTDSGPDIDPDLFVTEEIEFREMSEAWPACERRNSIAATDSIGVTVTYDYDFVTPLPVLVSAIFGGAPLTLSETTVMALNPTYD